MIKTKNIGVRKIFNASIFSTAMNKKSWTKRPTDEKLVQKKMKTSNKICLFDFKLLGKIGMIPPSLGNRIKDKEIKIKSWECTYELITTGRRKTNQSGKQRSPLTTVKIRKRPKAKPSNNPNFSKLIKFPAAAASEKLSLSIWEPCPRLKSELMYSIKRGF